MKTKSTSTASAILTFAAVLLSASLSFGEERANGAPESAGKAVPVDQATPDADQSSAEAQGPVDERPYEHTVLCEAAGFAISTGNVELLRALLQAGLSVHQDLDFKNRTSLLHRAADHNKPTIASLLISNGADLESTDSNGDRPIDIAFRDGAMEMCEVLRKPSEKEDEISGYPEQMLGIAFTRTKTPEKEILFLSINGADADAKLLKYFRKRWGDVRNRSEAELVDNNNFPDAKTRFRDIQSKEHGIIVELTLKKTDSSNFEYRHREASGPAMAGAGTGGIATHQYGYWLKHSESSWDE